MAFRCLFLTLGQASVEGLLPKCHILPPICYLVLSADASLQVPEILSEMQFQNFADFPGELGG